MAPDLGHDAALFRAELREADLARTSCVDFLLQGCPPDQALAAAYRRRAAGLRHEIARIEYACAVHAAEGSLTREVSLRLNRERETLLWAISFLDQLACAAYVPPSDEVVRRPWWRRR